MYKIETKKFAIKVLVVMAVFAFVFLGTFAYVLGFEINFISLLIYTLCMFVILFIHFLAYKIITTLNNNYCIINEKKITEYKKGTVIKEIEIKDINEMFYIKPIWILMLQIGACFLNIAYTEENQKKMYHISMSQKELEKVSKVINRKIEIR